MRRVCLLVSAVVCLGVASSACSEQIPPSVPPPVAAPTPPPAKASPGTTLPGDGSGVSKPGEPRILDEVEAFQRDEGFPTYFAHLVGTYFHLFSKITVENPSSKTVRVALRAGLPGYTSRDAEAVFELKPGEKRVVTDLDAPLDFEKLGKVSAPVPAQYRITLSVGSEVVSSWSSKAFNILPRGTVFWGVGPLERIDPSWAALNVASMTTPHDRWLQVDGLLARAATYSKYKSMVGYMFQSANRTAADNEADAWDQLGAIYNAMKSMGVIYTNVGQDFFAGSQNVRYPAESLYAKTANCIDGSLVFASALEAIGMKPYVFIVPSHAFAGVASTAAGGGFYVVETTMVSTGSFEDAVKSASDTWAKTAPADLITLDIAALRSEGVLPSPFPM